MALNETEVTKVNDLYKELDALRAHNESLTRSVQSMEAAIEEQNRHSDQHEKTLNLLEELLTLAKKKK